MSFFKLRRQGRLKAQTSRDESLEVPRGALRTSTDPAHLENVYFIKEHFARNYFGAIMF